MTGRNVILSACAVALLLVPRAAQADIVSWQIWGNVTSYTPSVSGAEAALGFGLGTAVTGNFDLNTGAVEHAPGAYRSPFPNSFLASIDMAVGEWTIVSSQPVNLTFAPGAMTLFLGGLLSGSDDVIYMTAQFDPSITSLDQLNAETVFPEFIVGQLSASGDDWSFSFEANPVEVTPVPEPATVALMGIGFLTVAGRLRRKSRLNA
jgi:hypothetical protein